jgi:hypothetical protein
LVVFRTAGRPSDDRVFSLKSTDRPEAVEVSVVHDAADVEELSGLSRFRAGIYECLTARADALFELAEAAICADGPVTSLVELSLEPVFRRSHGALYDALASGAVDQERLRDLLAAQRDRQDRRDRPEQAADPGSAVRRARPRPGTRRIHRCRARRQGPPDHRAGWLHRPAGRLRPAQAPRQATHQQTRPDPPLARPRRQRPRHRRATYPPRQRHRTDPGRGPQPQNGPQAQDLDRHRP